MTTLASEQLAQQAPSIDAASLFNQALAFHQVGLLTEAEQRYRWILSAHPEHFGCVHMCGLIEYQRGDHAQALRQIDHALKINPQSASAHNNRGVVLAELKRPDEALVSYDKAIALSPDYVDAFCNRGDAFRNLKHFDEALASYDRAVILAPDRVELHNKRANVLTELQRFDEAVASYTQATSLKPDFSEAFNNRGVALARLRRFHEAVESYDHAIALKRDDAEALNHRGQALVELARFDEAIASFDEAFALQPDLDYLRGLRMHAKMHVCDWKGFEDECSALASAVLRGTAASSPFPLIATPATAEVQLACAKRYCTEKYPASTTPLCRGVHHSHDRIRVAYLSADFREHATAHLLAGVFEEHDRSKFETIAVSFGPADDSEMRRRLARSFDRFVDVRAHSDQAIAEHLRELEIDIAVDLKGYTQDCRTDVLAKRPAPIQASYLGYPGTMAAPYIDYLIADRVVIPDGDEAMYSEKIVRLPDNYQANDGRRRISAVAPDRSAAGLPENGLVFCCFNNSYKITPDVFDVWMRLLRQVDSSVLWLLEGNSSAPHNLRYEAERRGVSGQRLIFAPRMRPDEHLARHQLADLCLDTYYCNAHTTASDALWSGVPLLTCMGQTFASRVAGSLLTAIGLPELITHTLTDYENLGLKLALDRALLTAIRERLSRHRTTHPLFDTARLTQHLEAAYVSMWERAARGEPPQSFAVAPLPSAKRQ
jgi:protein O-GlcNAc transferase